MDLMPPVRLPKRSLWRQGYTSAPLPPSSPLRDLDAIGFLESNPHRKLGTRFGQRQTLEKSIGYYSWSAGERSGTV
ncbi:hypothetical protein [Ktedonobacter sp. SOSP1-52]|uniref:hypothetical protein n=1 Tax=Ktedonobacter sp. SOSP1-52 TaxID=2778366 RepID=UPI0019151C66|nr:hypothetical protein [Ktedonobacter sp. SOSP1-52]